MVARLVVGFLLVCFVSLTTGILFGRGEDTLMEALEEIDDDCLALAAENDCGFYQCFVRRHPCASFLAEIMQTTCERMTSHKAELNEQGQTWLRNSRNCFHAHLIREYRKTSMSCSNFRDRAIGWYMTCATEVTPNFCEIFYANRAVIGEVLRVTPQEIIQNPRMGFKNIRGLIRMLAGCGSDHVKDYLKGVTALVSREFQSRFTLPWDKR